LRNIDNQETTGRQAGSHREEVLNEAKLQAKAAKDNIAAKAGETAREAKIIAYEKAEHQKQLVAKEVHDVNTALLKTAENLENPALQQRLRGLAEQVDRTAQRLEEAAVEEVVEAIEDFSRANPTVFVAASFGIGLLAGRFLNATKPNTLPAPTPQTSINLRSVEKGSYDEQPLIAR
jgi:ElaB/YqjD/DUF883 family membrane-anchored ribosome-binding protein